MRNYSPSTVLGFIVAVHPQSVDLIHFNSSLGAFASLHLRICSSLPMEGKEKPSNKQELGISWTRTTTTERESEDFVLLFISGSRKGSEGVLELGLSSCGLRNNDQNN